MEWSPGPKYRAYLSEIQQRYNRRVLNRRSDIADAISVDRGQL